MQNKHSWAEETIIHLPTKIIFVVNDRKIDYVDYDDDLKKNPEVLFYRFKYTSEYGKEYKFTAFCDLRGCGFSEEKLAEIRETVLVPGAKWYCLHFREEYRYSRGESPIDIALNRNVKDKE